MRWGRAWARGPLASYMLSLTEGLISYLNICYLQTCNYVCLGILQYCFSRAFQTHHHITVQNTPPREPPLWAEPKIGSAAEDLLLPKANQRERTDRSGAFAFQPISLRQPRLTSPKRLQTLQ